MMDRAEEMPNEESRKTAFARGLQARGQTNRGVVVGLIVNQI